MTPSQSEPLTCETALERLDAVWLDPLPEEPLDADLLAAREHLQECSTCWAEWERRVAADHRIAEVMQAIPVPTGLREQLLTQTVADAASVRRADASSVGYERRLRRRAWWISLAAMLLVGTAGGSWLWQLTHPQRVSMQTLCDQTPVDSAGLAGVKDLSQFPPLPATWSRTKGFGIVEAPRWFTLPNSRVTAGWIAFELRTKNSSIRGVLLATARTDVLDPPAPLLIRPSWSGYTQRGGKPVSVAGWSERNVVYLCFLPGEPPLLERVLRATAPTSA